MPRTISQERSRYYRKGTSYPYGNSEPITCPGYNRRIVIVPCVACLASRRPEPSAPESTAGPLPQDPTPDEILQRRRQVELARVDPDQSHRNQLKDVLASCIREYSLRELFSE